jgi:hypothetical protein
MNANKLSSDQVLTLAAMCMVVVKHAYDNDFQKVNQLNAN